MFQSKKLLSIFVILNSIIHKSVVLDHLVLLSYLQDMIKIINSNFTQLTHREITQDGKLLLLEAIMLLLIHS